MTLAQEFETRFPDSKTSLTHRALTIGRSS